MSSACSFWWTVTYPVAVEALGGRPANLIRPPYGMGKPQALQRHICTLATHERAFRYLLFFNRALMMLAPTANGVQCLLLDVNMKCSMWHERSGMKSQSVRRSWSRGYVNFQGNQNLYVLTSCMTPALAAHGGMLPCSMAPPGTTPPQRWGTCV